MRLGKNKSDAADRVTNAHPEGREDESMHFRAFWHLVKLINVCLPTIFVSRQVAADFAAVNERLMREGRRFMAIGMGRWGTSQPSLGIPVRWEQIQGAGVLVETGTPTFVIEPSSGTHFLSVRPRGRGQ